MQLRYEFRIMHCSVLLCAKNAWKSCGRLMYIKMVAKFQSSLLFCSARSGRRLALPIRTEAAILLVVYQ
jgi:hypothetical protein